ncbi:hypothetical protein BJV74DRAFT_154466 [Russula compacta]|nr:hypothetical protein BJV74DRAFT_154466 [Russula compacta]
MTSLTTLSTPVERPNDPSFAALPEEMIVKTLEYCDFKGVLSCQLTCRILRDVVTNSLSLRYKLALSKHGMCDDPSNKLSTARKARIVNRPCYCLAKPGLCPPREGGLSRGVERTDGRLV